MNGMHEDYYLIKFELLGAVNFVFATSQLINNIQRNLLHCCQRKRTIDFEP